MSKFCCVPGTINPRCKLRDRGPSRQECDAEHGPLRSGLYYRTTCNGCRRPARKGDVMNYDKLRGSFYCDACRRNLDAAAALLPSERLGVPPTTPDVDIKLQALEGTK